MSAMQIQSWYRNCGMSEHPMLTTSRRRTGRREHHHGGGVCGGGPREGEGLREDGHGGIRGAWLEGIERVVPRDCFVLGGVAAFPAARDN